MIRDIFDQIAIVARLLHATGKYTERQALQLAIATLLEPSTK